MDAVLSTADAAKRLGVTRRAVIKWIRQGKFPGTYKLDPDGIRSSYRIPEAAIEAFEERRRQTAL
jgi:excisionase family DNA binding protein